ncbi:TetR/AcrR family transcriptional regulator [Leptospira sp. 96542]|nr:TetR/AcrR family transcriptional regulator [Leptospira sp. 96542]
MARPKSYNRDDALIRACEVFWSRGYSGSGVRCIEEKTGLNQFAIQTEFGGKEGLYLEVIKLYANAAFASALQPIKTGGIASISTFFTGLVADKSPTSSEWGCLIVNAGIENAIIGNSKVEAECRAYWRTLQKCFTSALELSLKNKEINPSMSLKEYSKALVIAVMGIHTMNRAERSNKAGASMVKMVKQQIQNWSLVNE